MPTVSKATHLAQPLVHAVVVSWNGAALLPSCLAALERQEAPARLEVVLVDNGSQDDSLALVAREHPRVHAIALAENLGFGPANNVALRRALAAGADFVALVNNDVKVEPGWLAALLAAADAHPEAGLFSGTLFLAGTALVNSTGVELDRLGRARDRDYRLPRAALARADGPIEAICGGAALVRASTLRAVGLFDPAYFAYYEDVDLSLRARAAGIGCSYAGAARAEHRFGASFGAGSPRQRFLLGVGHLRTAARHQPWLKAAALVPGTAAYRALVRAPLFLAAGKPALALAEWRAAAAGGLAGAGELAARALGRAPRGPKAE